MNGTKRKYGFVFGAVAIALLMVSSATAVSMIHSGETRDILDYDDNEINVDSDVYLTTEHLLMLEEALPYLGDSEIAQVVQEIITEIEEKGYADSDDIQRIISDSGQILDVTLGLIEGGGPGDAGSLSMPKFGSNGLLWIHILKPSPLIWWHAEQDRWPDGDIDVLVNNNHWTSEHSALAFRFRGIMSDSWTFDHGNTIHYFRVSGFAQLIFISDGSSSSLSSSSAQILSSPQSNPQSNNPSPSQQNSQPNSQQSTTPTSTTRFTSQTLQTVGTHK